MHARKSLFFFLVLWLSFFPALLPARADETTDEAQQQLVSQAEDFRKSLKRVPLKAPEKPEIIEEEKEPATTELAGPSFFVKEVKLDGNTLFSKEDLKAYTSQFENRKIAVNDLKSLARLITNHYRARGYTTSRAYVPPQTVEANIVVIKIIEAKVGNIFVEGNKYFKARVYERALRFLKDKSFRYQDLETALYFFNQKADRTAKAYLIAGKDPLTSDIILKAQEYYPIHISYEFNNRGTKLTHRARHLVHFTHNNLLGYDDVMAATLSMAEEGAFDAGFASYEFPLEDNRTVLNLEASYVESMLIGHLKPAEIKGESLNITPGVTYTIIQRPALTLEGYAGFEFKDSKTLIDDHKSSFDRMRVLKIGPRFTFQDTGGRTLLSSDVHWGIPDFLGSSEEVDPAASRPNSGGDFIYYTASVARIQRLPREAFVIVRGSGQWTKDNLTSVEQYRLGGAFSVRGYPESDAAGDYGYNLSTEISVPPYFLPKNWEIPFTHKRWYDTLHLVYFLDGGKTFFRERSVESILKDKFLLGTGFGLRFNLDRNISLSVDLGFPIGDDSVDENQMQVHISALVGF